MDARRIPAPRVVLRLEFFDVQRIEYFSYQALQVRDVHIQLEIADRTPDIGGDQIQRLFSRGGESPNAQIAIQHHDRDIDAAEQIHQVVVDLAQFKVAVL